MTLCPSAVFLLFILTGMALDCTSVNPAGDLFLWTGVSSNAAPEVAHLSPTCGAINSEVVILGNHFLGTGPGDTTVRFNGVKATIVSITATRISVTVPAGARSGPITVTTSSGTATSAFDFIMTPAVDHMTLTLPIGGVETAASVGPANDMKVGYAALAVNSGSAPYGTAVFSYMRNGVVVSEVGVPAASPTLAARFFVDSRLNASVPGAERTGTVNIATGFAIGNRGAGPAILHLTLLDRDGVRLSKGIIRLEQDEHIAKYLFQLEPDFVLPPGFAEDGLGTLDIASDQPVSVLALRLTNNQRGDCLMTAMPTADLSRPEPVDAVSFPQVVDGGGYQTTLILMNTSNAIETGIIRFHATRGTAMAVRLADGGALDHQFSYSIHPGGFFRLVTDGSPPEVNAGWARLIPDPGTATPVGSGVYGLTQGGVFDTETGVPAAAPTTHARIYVDKSGRHDTGLAVANPGNSSLRITATAYHSDGSTPAGSAPETVDLPAFGHDAKFVWQIIDGLPEDFTGVLDLSAPAPFTALTLRYLTNERGEFLMTTFPIADFDQPPPSPVVFPHLADGGGYQTQFILLNTSGATSSVTLAYLGNDGLPVAIGQDCRAPTVPPAHDIRYRDIMGTHYEIRPEAGFVRNYTNAAVIFGKCDVTGTSSDLQYAYVGPYSGETRYHDLAAPRAAQVALRASGMRTLPIPNLTNRPRSESEACLANDSKYLKDLYYHMFVELNTDAQAHWPQLLWQLGNEINNPNFCNVQPLDTPIEPPWPEFNTPQQREAYVQKFFGPVCEALQDASREVYGSYDAVQIVMGSVANGASAGSRQWLDDLMNSQINSPGCLRLNGTYVKDHVDYISIHYTIPSREFFTIYRELFDSWVAPGIVKGLWATEEHGNSGRGAPQTVRIAGRALYFWQSGNRSWQPDRSHVTFWGDRNAKDGGTGQLGEQIMWSFFGERPVRVEASDREDPSKVAASTPLTDPEFYVFSTDARTKMLLFLDEGSGGSTVNWLEIDNLGEAANSKLLALRLSDEAPPAQLTISRRENIGDKHRVTFSMGQTLADFFDVIVLMFGDPAMALPSNLGPPPPLRALTDANVEDHTEPHGDAGTDVIGATASTNKVGIMNTGGTEDCEMRNVIKFPIARINSNLINSAAYLTLRIQDVVAPENIGGIVIEDISANDYINFIPEDFQDSVKASQGGIPSNYEDLGIFQVDIRSMLNKAVLRGDDYLKLRLRAGNGYGAAAGNRYYVIGQSDTGDLRIPPMILGVSAVSNLRAQPGEGQVRLTWTNPTDWAFAGVQIQRGTSEFPAFPEEGETVYKGNADTFTDTGLADGTVYYYTVFAVDGDGLFAQGVRIDPYGLLEANGATGNHTGVPRRISNIS